MPQLHLYVSDEVAERLRERAAKENMSLSRYLARLVEREASAGWPPGYFTELFGSWEDAPEIPDLTPQEREAL